MRLAEAPAGERGIHEAKNKLSSLSVKEFKDIEGNHTFSQIIVRVTSISVSNRDLFRFES